MEAGELAPWVAEFAAELGSKRHTDLTIGGYTACARHFAAWRTINNIGLDELNDQALDRFMEHRCRCGGYRQPMAISRKYMKRIRRFLLFLAGRGVIPAFDKAAGDPIDPHVAEFQEWLRRHRGICNRTIVRHGRMVMRLLPALGRDPRSYDAATIRKAIPPQAQQCSPVYTKTMTTALRGYLRFLAAADLCAPGFEHAVPAIPQWRLSSLPRYLPPAQVEQVIACCDLRREIGIRDRAILLLLARLGLRAGDICG
jgi:site-specific recombinase XerD